MPNKKDTKINILQKDCPILREISKSILKEEIDSKEIKKIISDLQKAIDSQADAVAISAIQIGKPVRLFVISKRIFSILEELNGEKIKDTEKKDLIFINPKITKMSKDRQLIEEGCLSVRYIYGKVSRSSKVTVEYFDENGKKFSRGFSGLFAQVVQHENDHLDGILFIDKAVDIQEISPEEFEKTLKS
ncbi:MAG: peptide deformylase [Candidatus Pacebacteria bacterium]|nr:peptide deformylase [Candidatus Paceibacterota bacterium]